MYTKLYVGVLHNYEINSSYPELTSSNKQNLEDKLLKICEEDRGYGCSIDYEIFEVYIPSQELLKIQECHALGITKVYISLNVGMEIPECDIEDEPFVFKRIIEVHNVISNENNSETMFALYHD